MNKAYKFRLYPTTEQKQLFARTFGCVRFIYNHMLADRILYYEQTKKALHNTPAQYKAAFPWLKEVDSLALANAQLHLNAAYNNFFRNPKGGYPKYKSKKDNYCSYSTNNQKESVRLENNKLKLPKIGFVKINLHRQLPINAVIKTVTVSKTPTDKYYVSILVEYENQVLPVIPKTFIGLDFAMHELYVDSNGVSADYPRFYRRSQERLAKLSRQISKCKLGSSNRRKIRLKVAKLQERVANQRKDFLHKLSAKLIADNDCIAIEDLNMRGMSQALSFGKSVADNGWGMFTNMLMYKAAWAGKTVVKVDKFYPSSQLCHVCGYKNEATKNLAVREWTCSQCGTHHNRDHNAAINICNEGRRIATA